MQPTTLSRMSLCGLSLSMMMGFAQGEEGADRRPNLVLILADDMGYSDLSCYGGEIGTPSIDSLAQGGLRFSHFYNGAKCAPTRAALLTGLYHHQSGIHRSMIRNDNGATIAELLQQAGYTTMMVGNPMMTGIWRQPELSRSRGFDLHFSFGFGEECVQRRLVCSVGVSPTGARVRSPVSWIALVEETKLMKPIDKAILGMVSESPGRNASEPRGGLEKNVNRRPSPLLPGEGSMVCCNLAAAAGHSGGVVGAAR